MFISIHNAGSDVVRIMTETQSPHFHEPQAPRFVLTDRKGKFALGVCKSGRYGYSKQNPDRRIFLSLSGFIYENSIC